MIVDIIILSKTDNENIYQMNLNCINSLLKSEDKSKISFNIILVESNKTAAYEYPETRLIYPKETFGYNKFLNIGLQQAKGDFHAFCNNDLIFHEYWMTNIIAYSNNNPKILSFSPIDFNYSAMKKIADGIKPNWGYVPKYHIAGWCIVVKKEIFKIIDPIFDPIFDFYYADDDYGLTLLKNNIQHRLVVNSLVDHLESKTVSCNFDEQNNLDLLEKEGINYPQYLRKEKFRNYTFNLNILRGYLKLYNKWGGHYSLNIKYILFKRLPFLRIKWITKLLYSLKFNF
jgi:GT2 family glycosyltransferase